MKRPTRTKPDVDTNGRMRRQPVTTDPRKQVEAKFLDGPIAGQTRLVPKGLDFLMMDGFAYSYAGVEGRTPLYCRHPHERKVQKLLLFLIGRMGRDPRRIRAEMAQKPFKQTGPNAHERARLRKVERRNVKP